MRIAVIGASGHLGGAVAREALSRGHDVTAIARETNGLRELDGARATDADVLDIDAMTKVDEALAQARALEILRGANGAVDWSYVSPPPIQLVEGERTGSYRVRAGDLPIIDEQGESRITVPDYAAALVDALEGGRFVGERFTAAY